MSLETIQFEDQKLLAGEIRLDTHSKSHINEGFISLSYMTAELSLIFLLGLTIAHFYVGGILGQPGYYSFYVTPLLLGPMIIAGLFSRLGFYNPVNLQRPAHIALGLMKNTGLAFVLLILLGFIAGIASDYSRVWFSVWSFASIGLIMLLRSVFAQLLAKLTNLEIRMSRIAFLGDEDAMARTAKSMTTENSGLEIVGMFAEKAGKPGTSQALKDLIELGQRTVIDRIVITKNAIERNEITDVLDRLSCLPCEVVIHPGFLGDIAKVSEVAPFQDESVIRVQKRPISQWGLLAKSVMDKLMAAAGLIVLAPLFVLVAALIKLDSRGPVFFKQIRHGYNQKKIKVWKFRTMSVMEQGDAFRQATKNDARVTTIGAFLRKTSIDELPQLFNVLMGEMSIVGPRPHPVALNDDFRNRLRRYDNRHKVKPGITGWAQVNGHRGPTDKPGQMDKRVEFDLDYIENWSFWFDLKIILATPFYGLLSKNAF